LTMAQYFFCLVLQEVRNQLKPAPTTESVVDELVWLDDNKQDQESQGQGSQKNKSKNKKKKEKKKAKKSRASNTATDVESVSDVHDNDELLPTSSLHSPSVSSLDGNDQSIAVPALEREPS